MKAAARRRHAPAPVDSGAKRQSCRSSVLRVCSSVWLTTARRSLMAWAGPLEPLSSVDAMVVASAAVSAAVDSWLQAALLPAAGLARLFDHCCVAAKPAMVRLLGLHRR